MDCRPLGSWPSCPALTLWAGVSCYMHGNVTAVSSRNVVQATPRAAVRRWCWAMDEYFIAAYDERDGTFWGAHHRREQCAGSTHFDESATSRSCGLLPACRPSCAIRVLAMRNASTGMGREIFIISPLLHLRPLPTR